MTNPRPTNRLKWLLYLSLITLRLYGAINTLPGYIHPDEFFQGGQELFFGQQRDDTQHHWYAVRNVPWEFEPKNAVRCIVPPTFMTLLPLRAYVSVKSIAKSSQECKSSSDTSRHSLLWSPQMEHLSGREILTIPRVFMTLLSFIFLDGALWLLIFCKQCTRRDTKLFDIIYFMYEFGPPTETIILASSWPCLVFGIRPFTNTLEAMCLAVLLVIVNLDLSKSRGSNRLSAIYIGVVCSIGIFVRFTFAFFAFPAVLIWVWYRWKACYRQLHFFYDILLTAMSFLATSTIVIWADSQYYSLQIDGGSIQVFRDVLRYIVPLNAFLYNSKSTNLADHGLHPRFTHALVNMPMLFGPLALCCYGSMAQRFFGLINRRDNLRNATNVDCTCKWVIISGLFVLSCAPHQEPRFLLPCLVPLVVLCGKQSLGLGTGVHNHQKQSKSTIFILVWVSFNVILYTFFGWLHQGALIDTLIHTQSIACKKSLPSIHLYYKTYMPPSFLAREDIYSQSEAVTIQDQCKSDVAESDSSTSSELLTNQEECKAATSQPNNIILDLQGSEPSVLLNVLQSYLTCSENDSSIYLTTPLAVVASILSDEQHSQNELTWHGYSFDKVYASPYVHVSTEDWPKWNGSVVNFVSQLRLVTYEVKCR